MFDEELIMQILEEGTREVVSSELIPDGLGNTRPTLVRYTHDLGTVQEDITYINQPSHPAWASRQSITHTLVSNV